MNRVIPLVVAVTLGLLVGCQGRGKQDVDAAKQEVKTVMEQINTAWETEDLALFSRLVAHDPSMVNFGTDINDRWIGWEGLKSGLIQQFEVFSETEVTPRHIDITISASGNTAWIAQSMNIKTSFLGSPVDLECRITCILVEHSDTWKLVHFHYSVPISESRSLGM
jgi:uncharacterized protein (TIGR02246 family)